MEHRGSEEPGDQVAGRPREGGDSDADASSADDERRSLDGEANVAGGRFAPSELDATRGGDDRDATGK